MFEIRTAINAVIAIVVDVICTVVYIIGTAVDVIAPVGDCLIVKRFDKEW